MVLPWADNLDRTQLVRRAAKLLAYHHAIEASQPHEWRIHILASELLKELHNQGYPVHAQLDLFTQQPRHLNLDTGEVTVLPRQVVRAHAHIKADTNLPCLHLIDGDRTRCNGQNLLDDGALWTKPAAHTALAQFLRLDGAAASRHILGPWQEHDPRRAATLRAALVGLMCRRAYDEERIRNPPVLTVGRMWQIGRTVEETFVTPWRTRFQALLALDEDVKLEDGRKVRWKFAQPKEKHEWTLHLAWAIAKEARSIRLDCPPLVVPLDVFRRRGELAPQAALVRYLVDDSDGPRLRASAAARYIGLNEHAVHEMISSIRASTPRPEVSAEEEWDPLAQASGIVVPVALNTSPSGRDTNGGPASGGEP